MDLKRLVLNNFYENQTDYAKKNHIQNKIVMLEKEFLKTLNKDQQGKYREIQDLITNSFIINEELIVEHTFKKLKQIYNQLIFSSQNDDNLSSSL